MSNLFDLSPYLSSFACKWRESKGRLHKEVETSVQDRSLFQHDRDRIIHSKAFRRLMNKTQVFISPEVDYYRTRLTHTLEVSQIARSISRCFGVDEDLTEAIALSHDLGHPPYGHTGEKALNIMMKDFGGFNHNHHTLRIVTKLEWSYLSFQGLNLSWETMEGLIKHNGALNENTVLSGGINYPLQDNRNFKTGLNSSIESQIAAISDELAYNHHDLEDGLLSKILTLDHLCSIEYISKIREEINNRTKKINSQELEIKELKRKLIHNSICDLINSSKERMINRGITTVDEVRNLKEDVIDFSPEWKINMGKLKSYLKDNLLKNDSVVLQRSNAFKKISNLFKHYLDNPQKMPKRFHSATINGEKEKYIAIKDYIGCMTDDTAAKCFANIT